MTEPKPRQRQIPHSTPILSLQTQRKKHAPPLAGKSALGAATARIWQTPGKIPT